MSEVFGRILVAVSGTESSQAAVEMALRMARVHGAQVVMLNVVDTGLAEGMARVLKRSIDDVLAEMAGSGQGYLRDGARMGQSVGVPVRTIQRQGVPYREIAAAIDSEDVDLVVLGSTHVERLRRLAIGRVVERVIEHADVPVLVVRHRVRQ